MILLLLLALGYGILAPSLMRARLLARRVACAENLEKIYFAIEAYRESYSRQYPPTLRSLVEAGLLDAERLHCPETDDDSGDSYDYFPPSPATSQHFESHVLVRDRAGNHGGNADDKKVDEGRNVLYANGTGQWVDRRPEEWEEIHP